MENTRIEKRRTGLGTLSLLLTITGIIAMIALSFFAVREMAGVYHGFVDADLSQGYSGTLSYNDHLYAQVGQGIEIVESDADKEGIRYAFLDSALHTITERIIASLILYTMVICVAGALFLCECFGRKQKAHTLSTVLSTVLVFALLAGATVGMFMYFGVPFPIPSAGVLISEIASIASVAGGGCAFALLLRNVGAKQIVAVVALPLSIGLIISGSLVEAGIFAVPTFDSFDYAISTIPEDRIDEAYYDEDLDAIVFDGIEYPPEKVPNPNLLEGPKRIAGIAYELLNPFAGNCIDMVRQFDDEVSIPVWIYPIYLLKAFVWMLLSSLGRGRNAGDGANGAREEPEPRIEREEHIGRHFAPRA